MRWKRLRRSWIFLILIVVLLVVVTSCQLSMNVFTEKKALPKEVESYVDDEATLQLINEGTKGAYIIFRSSGEVEADSAVKANEMKIDFHVSHEDEAETERMEHIYYLKENFTYETIRVFVNKEEIPFNNVTGM